MRKLLSLLLVLCALSGCSSAPYRYVANRLDDLTDVAHVQFSVLDLGFLINAGPFELGTERFGVPFPLLPDAFSLRLGAGGPQIATLDGLGAGIGIPLSSYDQSVYSIYNLSERPASYGTKGPAWGSVGFGCGLGVGVAFRGDVVEFVDFLLGFFTIDLCGDDVEAEEEEKPAEPAAATPDDG